MKATLLSVAFAPIDIHVYQTPQIYIAFEGKSGTIGWQMEMEKRMLKEKDSKSFLNFLKQLISDLDCVLELFLALQTNVKVLKG